MICDPIIDVKNITKTVTVNEQELKILRPTSFTIYPKESVAIIGASGSGKSTLLSLLAGLDVASSGELYLAGQGIHDADEEGRAAIRASNVGFIFQSFMLIQSLSALENVMLPLELAKQSNAKEQAIELLSEVGLSERLEHFPNQMSGGEQQRVAIARAFACKPKILFADEPTGNLDSVNGAKVESLLFNLNKEHGTTLVLVTHDLNLAKRCQRRFHMQAGVLAEHMIDVHKEESNVG